MCKIYSSILLGFQFLVFSLYGQDSKLINYANFNSTTISAEYLDQQMILETVDGNYSWDGSWQENNWYFFEFNQEIDISQVNFGLYNNTCLDNCNVVFQVITNDTIVELNVDSMVSMNTVSIKADKILINRKDVYPKGPAHINEIEILSYTEPYEKKIGKPKIRLGKKKRLDIKYSFIEGLNEDQINDKFKIWSARKNFYKKNIKGILGPSEQMFFKDRIFYGHDEKWFCYKVRNLSSALSNENLVELFDYCGCEIRELFFERQMAPTNRMLHQKFDFLGNLISYNSDSSKLVLLGYLRGGNAWAGHAIPHICLLGMDEYIGEIDSLQNDSNTFTQIQAIRGLIFFNEYEKGLNIAKKIYRKEVESLTNDSVSIYGQYAVSALILVYEHYPDEILPKMIELYYKYRSLYPKEMDVYADWTSAYLYDNESGKRIESLQGCDQRLLDSILGYLERFPSALKNPNVQKFKDYIDKVSPERPRQ